MVRRPAASAFALSLLIGLPACAGGSDSFAPSPHQTANFANIPYATWSDSEPPYRLYPGDELDVQVSSAPELNKTVTVQPDGRVSLPLIQPVLVADRSVADAEAALSDAYGAQLLRPQVSITVRAAPLRVFVGGEVDKTGVYDMPGDINALQAIVMAGGFRAGARKSQVVIIRRGPGGRAMMRTVDLVRGISDPANNDLIPLRRFDIVYVPKTTILEADQFVQQHLRDILPFNADFSYATGPAKVF